MVCSICKQAGHTKPRCPIKREYSAVLYKYIVAYNSYYNLEEVFAGLSRCYSKVSTNDLDILGEFIVNKKNYTEVWEGRTKWERSILCGMSVGYRNDMIRSLQDLPFTISRANYKKELICHYIINNRLENLLTEVDEHLIRNGTLNAHFRQLLVPPNLLPPPPPAKTENYGIKLKYCSEISISEDDNTCPICYETLDKTNVFVSNCNHKTCIGCFEQCFKEFQSNQKIPTCCICRETITTLRLSNEDTYHRLLNNYRPLPRENEIIVID